ncbi:MAG: OsmC family protein [Thermomicrobiales bacterium]|nr:OsmC family protein [Thermomicrobiales bacterium]
MVAEVQPQTDRLGGVIEQVRQNLSAAPEPPIATFAVTTALVDEYQTRVQIRDFSLTVDEPEQIGGNNTGPTPVELVLAALGTCQEIVYATYARVLGIPLNGVEVSTEGRLDLRGFFGVADLPAGFQDVTFTVAIDSPAAPEDISRLVAAVNAHCPVLDILQQPVPVSGTYLLNGAELSA